MVRKNNALEKYMNNMISEYVSNSSFVASNKEIKKSAIKKNFTKYFKSNEIYKNFLARKGDSSKLEDILLGECLDKVVDKFNELNKLLIKEKEVAKFTDIALKELKEYSETKEIKNILKARYCQLDNGQIYRIKNAESMVNNMTKEELEKNKIGEELKYFGIRFNLQNLKTKDENMYYLYEFGNKKFYIHYPLFIILFNLIVKNMKNLKNKICYWTSKNDIDKEIEQILSASNDDKKIFKSESTVESFKDKMKWGVHTLFRCKCSDTEDSCELEMNEILRNSLSLMQKSFYHYNELYCVQYICKNNNIEVVLINSMSEKRFDMRYGEGKFKEITEVFKKHIDNKK